MSKITGNFINSYELHYPIVGRDSGILIVGRDSGILIVGRDSGILKFKKERSRGLWLLSALLCFVLQHIEQICWIFFTFSLIKIRPNHNRVTGCDHYLGKIILQLAYLVFGFDPKSAGQGALLGFVRPCFTYKNPVRLSSR